MVANGSLREYMGHDCLKADTMLFAYALATTAHHNCELALRFLFSLWIPRASNPVPEQSLTSDELSR